jgi:hypothetical protein
VRSGKARFGKAMPGSVDVRQGKDFKNGKTLGIYERVREARNT